MTEETTEKVNDDDESKKSPMPKAVPFILINVFLERFSTGGILGDKISTKA